MKFKFDWKFAGLIVALAVGLFALDVPPWTTVFAILVCTVSNIIGFSDGIQRGAAMMKDKADEFFKQLQQLMTETLGKAKEVVEYERSEAAHLKARLAKYEDVEDDKPAVH